MKKNNKIIIIVLFAISYLFASCAKEEALVLSSNKLNPIEEFNKSLEQSIANPSPGGKSVSLEFPDNPYDNAGEAHNKMVDFLYKNGYMDQDFPHLIQGASQYSGINFSEKSDFLYTLLIDAANGIYKQDMSYNSDYIDNLENIPDLEKATLNSYFEKLSGVEDIDLLIAVSKDAEQFILDSKDYPADSKERILTTFAIYRHSTSFWNDNAVFAKQPDFGRIDAVGEEIGFICGDGVGCNDAKDVYHFAGLFSASMFMLWVRCPYVFNFK